MEEVPAKVVRRVEKRAHGRHINEISLHLVKTLPLLLQDISLFRTQRSATTEGLYCSRWD